MKRTFIAFDIIPSGETKDCFNSVMHKLRNERIAWVKPDQLHVTLKFLGDTDEDKIPLIKEALSDVVSSSHPFQIKLNSMGVFRNLHDPRVLWIGCWTDNSLAVLRDAIESSLSLLGFERENRSFSPHITLGRIKLMRQTNHLSEIIATYRDKEFQESLINEIVYYESRLSTEGAVYTPIEKFKFPPFQSLS